MTSEQKPAEGNQLPPGWIEIFAEDEHYCLYESEDGQIFIKVWQQKGKRAMYDCLYAAPRREPRITPIKSVGMKPCSSFAEALAIALAWYYSLIETLEKIYYAN